MSTLPAYHPDRPWLALAPHLCYPTRNGADILADRTARHASNHVPFVDLVASDRVLRFRQGREISSEPFANRLRSKQVAALRTLLKRSHYLVEKFNTPAFAAQAARLLERDEYGTVFHSYISTAALAGSDPARRLHVVATHNDEIKWHGDRAAEDALPASLVARQSLRWIRHFLASRSGEFAFAHVTDEDRKGFDAVMPGHRFLIVPVGADVPLERAAPLPPGQPVRLLFVGSLSVKMNADALAFFKSRFEPSLKAQFGPALQIDVAGSRPGSKVKQLCESPGWTLHADVSDERLAALYAACTCAILPFQYATGAKLKLVGALAHGVAVATTRASHSESILLSHPHCVSDRPQDWGTAIGDIAESGVSAEDRLAIAESAEPFVWPSVVQAFVTELGKS